MKKMERKKEKKYFGFMLIACNRFLSHCPKLLEYA
jgi:hypothetical protein